MARKPAQAAKKKTAKPAAAAPPALPRDRAAQRREQILRCAIQRFAAEGYDHALLDRVAGDTGCAKGTLYNYFQNKDEVFTAATDFVMRELLERTQASENDDPLQRIEDAVRGYLGFFDEHPEYIELLIQERAGFKTRSNSTYFQYRNAKAAQWRDEFAALMRQGRVRQMPPDQPFQLIGDLLYGTIFTHRLTGNGTPLSARADAVIDLLRNGLLTENERSAAAKPARRPPRRRNEQHEESKHGNA
jgi:AcrR family transcriptional regulator